jgi:hypothetical protein
MMPSRWIVWLLSWTAVACLAGTPGPGWVSGYETWPAPEWFVWEGSNYRPRDESASGTNGWTVVCGTGDALEGDCALKAWVNAAYCNGTSCRAYPGMHDDIPMPLIDVFWIRIDELEFAGNGWFSLFTHANVNWSVNTMSLVGAPGREWHLEMAHLPHRRVGNPGPVFRLGQWHRVTSYLNWRPSGDGTVIVWIDGVKTFEGASGLEGNLPRAHYGAYTFNVRRAVLWNDGHRICPLPGPLTDLEAEPRCPGDRRPRPPVVED